MQNTAQELADALRERLAVVADDTSRRDTARHMTRLKNISERIETLQAQLPKPVDPQLAHYLQRASYTKALEFLDAGNSSG